jgi:hypothetical protein
MPTFPTKHRDIILSSLDDVQGSHRRRSFHGGGQSHSRRRSSGEGEQGSKSKRHIGGGDRRER